MSYKVLIEPGNFIFDTNQNETILSSAINAKINLPYSCNGGSCGTCKCKIKNGTIQHIPYSKNALSDIELANNYILPCRAYAKSNLVLDIPNFTNANQIKTMLTKIQSLKRYSDVIILKLQLITPHLFEYQPGQYINILKDGVSRNYSIANLIQKDNIIELNIRYREGGAFSEIILSQLACGQTLRIKGPIGNFILKKNSAPILMVCTGTGFAPIKAMIESSLINRESKPIHLIWGNYTPDNFYYIRLLNQWQKKFNITVTMCSSKKFVTGYFYGRVTDYINQNFNELRIYEVYACGNPAMIDALYRLTTTKLKLNKNNFYAETFI